jgi:alginate O-acetyltransferase complex protein AlgI
MPNRRAALLPLALALLTVGAALGTASWVRMAWVTTSLFWLAKALVLASSPGARPAPGRLLAYVLLWPGMETRAFFDVGRRARAPRAGEWAEVAFTLACGAGLLAWAVSHVDRRDPTLVAVVGLAGLALLVLFGVLGASSLCLRKVGVEAMPILRAPWLAASVSDLWGRRWNRAFHEMARVVVLAPLRGRVPRWAAVALVFLLSGLAHELIVSWPAGGGTGGPTGYFLIQAIGLFVERSALGAHAGLRGGWGGRAALCVFTLAPLPLLFHGPFVRQVLVPFLRMLGSL